MSAHPAGARWPNGGEIGISGCMAADSETSQENVQETAAPAANAESSAPKRRGGRWWMLLLGVLVIEFYVYGSRGEIEVCVGKAGEHDFALLGQERTDANRGNSPAASSARTWGCVPTTTRWWKTPPRERVAGRRCCATAARARRAPSRPTGGRARCRRTSCGRGIAGTTSTCSGSSTRLLGCSVSTGPRASSSVRARFAVAGPSAR